MKSFSLQKALRAAVLAVVLCALASGASISAQNNSGGGGSSQSNNTTTTTTQTTRTAQPAGTTRTETSRTTDYTWAWIGGIAVLAIVIVTIIAMSRRSSSRA
ncbi:MAG TPA: hypothetical protein VGB73_09070 [Pyrinomonadaceae bacterium]|jgi:hypothetical protein